MCAPDAPAAPDYTGAAKTQGAANTQAAIASALLNRGKQVTPYGTQTWTQQGNIDIPQIGDVPGFQLPNYGSEIALTPQAQKIFDTQMQQSEGMADLGNQSLQQTQSSLGKPLDTSGVKQLQDKAYGAMTARLDPQWAQAGTSRETQLTNQGLRPGGEAYDNAMRVHNQAKNDAYQQAQLAALGYGPQLLQEETAMRQLPLNELNALRTGSQVGVPQFQGSQAPSVGAPNYQNAAAQQAQYQQGLYNAQAGQSNAMQSGLFSLAASAIPMFMMGASDRRLKSNIERIGMHPLGIGIYSYEMFGRRSVGVMADEVREVLPEAAILHPSGYWMVDYARL